MNMKNNLTIKITSLVVTICFLWETVVNADPDILNQGRQANDHLQVISSFDGVLGSKDARYRFQIAAETEMIASLITRKEGITVEDLNTFYEIQLMKASSKNLLETVDIIEDKDNISAVVKVLQGEDSGKYFKIVCPAAKKCKYVAGNFKIDELSGIPSDHRVKKAFCFSYPLKGPEVPTFSVEETHKFNGVVYGSLAGQNILPDTQPFAGRLRNIEWARYVAFVGQYSAGREENSEKTEDLVLKSDAANLINKSPERQGLEKHIFQQTSKDPNAVGELVDNSIDSVLKSEHINMPIGQFGKGSLQIWRFINSPVGKKAFLAGDEADYAVWSTSASDPEHPGKGDKGEKKRNVIYYMNSSGKRCIDMEEKVEKCEPGAVIRVRSGNFKGRKTELENYLREVYEASNQMRIFLNGELINDRAGMVEIDGIERPYVISDKAVSIITHENGFDIVDQGLGMDRETAFMKLPLVRSGTNQEIHRAITAPGVKPQGRINISRDLTSGEDDKMELKFIVGSRVMTHDSRSFTGAVPLPRKLWINFPPSVKLTDAKDEVIVDENVFEDFLYIVDRVLETNPPDVIAVINGLSAVVEYLHKKDKAAQDFYGAFMRRVRPFLIAYAGKNNIVYLPALKEIERINSMSGKTVVRLCPFFYRHKKDFLDKYLERYPYFSGGSLYLLAGTGSKGKDGFGSVSRVNEDVFVADGTIADILLSLKNGQNGALSTPETSEGVSEILKMVNCALESSGEKCRIDIPRALNAENELLPILRASSRFASGPSEEKEVAEKLSTGGVNAAALEKVIGFVNSLGAKAQEKPDLTVTLRKPADATAVVGWAPGKSPAEQEKGSVTDEEKKAAKAESGNVIKKLVNSMRNWVYENLFEEGSNNVCCNVTRGGGDTLEYNATVTGGFKTNVLVGLCLMLSLTYFAFLADVIVLPIFQTMYALTSPTDGRVCLMLMSLCIFILFTVLQRYIFSVKVVPMPINIPFYLDLLAKYVFIPELVVDQKNIIEREMDSYITNVYEGHNSLDGAFRKTKAVIYNIEHHYLRQKRSVKYYVDLDTGRSVSLDSPLLSGNEFLYSNSYLDDEGIRNIMSIYRNKKHGCAICDHIVLDGKCRIVKRHIEEMRSVKLSRDDKVFEVDEKHRLIIGSLTQGDGADAEEGEGMRYETINPKTGEEIPVDTRVFIRSLAKGKKATKEDILKEYERIGIKEGPNFIIIAERTFIPNHPICNSEFKISAIEFDPVAGKFRYEGPKNGLNFTVGSVFPGKMDVSLLKKFGKKAYFSVQLTAPGGRLDLNKYAIASMDVEKNTLKYLDVDVGNTSNPDCFICGGKFFVVNAGDENISLFTVDGNDNIRDMHDRIEVINRYRQISEDYVFIMGKKRAEAEEKMFVYDVRNDRLKCLGDIDSLRLKGFTDIAWESINLENGCLKFRYHFAAPLPPRKVSDTNIEYMFKYNLGTDVFGISGTGETLSPAETAVKSSMLPADTADILARNFKANLLDEDVIDMRAEELVLLCFMDQGSIKLLSNSGKIELLKFLYGNTEKTEVIGLFAEALKHIVPAAREMNGDAFDRIMRNLVFQVSRVPGDVKRFVKMLGEGIVIDGERISGRDLISEKVVGKAPASIRNFWLRLKLDPDTEIPEKQMAEMGDSGHKDVVDSLKAGTPLAHVLALKSKYYSKKLKISSVKKYLSQKPFLPEVTKSFNEEIAANAQDYTTMARELVQNARDALRESYPDAEALPDIDMGMYLAPLKSGGYGLVFEVDDKGAGMDEYVILNKLFPMDETTKKQHFGQGFYTVWLNMRPGDRVEIETKKTGKYAYRIRQSKDAAGDIIIDEMSKVGVTGQDVAHSGTRVRQTRRFASKEEAAMEYRIMLDRLKFYTAGVRDVGINLNGKRLNEKLIFGSALRFGKLGVSSLYFGGEYNRVTQDMLAMPSPLDASVERYWEFVPEDVREELLSWNVSTDIAPGIYLTESRTGPAYEEFWPYIKKSEAIKVMLALARNPDRITSPKLVKKIRLAVLSAADYARKDPDIEKMAFYINYEDNARGGQREFHLVPEAYFKDEEKWLQLLIRLKVPVMDEVSGAKKGISLLDSHEKAGSIKGLSAEQNKSVYLPSFSLPEVQHVEKTYSTVFTAVVDRIGEEISPKYLIMGSRAFAADKAAKLYPYLFQYKRFFARTPYFSYLVDALKMPFVGVIAFFDLAKKLLRLKFIAEALDRLKKIRFRKVLNIVLLGVVLFNLMWMTPAIREKIPVRFDVSATGLAGRMPFISKYFSADDPVLKRLIGVFEGASRNRSIYDIPEVICHVEGLRQGEMAINGFNDGVRPDKQMRGKSILDIMTLKTAGKKTGEDASFSYKMNNVKKGRWIKLYYLENGLPERIVFDNPEDEKNFDLKYMGQGWIKCEKSIGRECGFTVHVPRWDANISVNAGDFYYDCLKEEMSKMPEELRTVCGYGSREKQEIADRINRLVNSSKDPAIMYKIYFGDPRDIPEQFKPVLAELDRFIQGRINAIDEWMMENCVYDDTVNVTGKVMPYVINNLKAHKKIRGKCDLFARIKWVLVRGAGAYAFIGDGTVYNGDGVLSTNNNHADLYKLERGTRLMKCFWKSGEDQKIKEDYKLRMELEEVFSRFMAGQSVERLKAFRELEDLVNAIDRGNKDTYKFGQKLLKIAGQEVKKDSVICKYQQDETSGYLEWNMKSVFMGLTLLFLAVIIISKTYRIIRLVYPTNSKKRELPARGAEKDDNIPIGKIEKALVQLLRDDSGKGQDVGSDVAKPMNTPSDKPAAVSPQTFSMDEGQSIAEAILREKASIFLKGMLELFAGKKIDLLFVDNIARKFEAHSGYVAVDLANCTAELSALSDFVRTGKHGWPVLRAWFMMTVEIYMAANPGTSRRELLGAVLNFAMKYNEVSILFANIRSNSDIASSIRGSLQNFEDLVEKLSAAGANP
ncbi:MAG: hypothetical protein HQL28_02280 [Candidatus Omnitrophica bacterium]|nr:hypothetical protein [Candidatus Omnitrophota bacterium]